MFCTRAVTLRNWRGTVTAASRAARCSWTSVFVSAWFSPPRIENETVPPRASCACSGMRLSTPAALVTRTRGVTSSRVALIPARQREPRRVGPPGHKTEAYHPPTPTQDERARCHGLRYLRAGWCAGTRLRPEGDTGFQLLRGRAHSKRQRMRRRRDHDHNGRGNTHAPDPSETRATVPHDVSLFGHPRRLYFPVNACERLAETLTLLLAFVHVNPDTTGRGVQVHSRYQSTRTPRFFI